MLGEIYLNDIYVIQRKIFRCTYRRNDATKNNKSKQKNKPNTCLRVSVYTVCLILKIKVYFRFLH